MKHVIWKVVIVLALCGPAQAEELLPVALGHKSIAFTLDGRQPPLPQGARVTFTVEDENGVPRDLRRTTGFVLGTKDDIVFVELTDENSIKIARHRALGDVKLKKANDPAAEEVAVRKGYRDSGNMILLAPQMRRMTVTMSVTPATVSEWTPGETLKFLGAREGARQVKINDEWKTETVYRDVSAMFRFADKRDDGLYDVTIVAGPHDVDHILKAELEDRLKVEESNEPILGVSEQRCFITHRHGNERNRVEIPCTN